VSVKTINLSYIRYTALRIRAIPTSQASVLSLRAIRRVWRQVTGVTAISDSHAFSLYGRQQRYRNVV